MSRQAWADGLVTWRGEQPLEAFFPAPHLGELPADGVAHEIELSRAERDDPVRGVTVKLQRVVSSIDDPIEGTAEAYLRLHLLSHRLVQPKDMNLDGIFAAMPNVCWTSLGPVHPTICSRSSCGAGRPAPSSRFWGLDKFLKMLDYVVPSGVRIADASRVRLGAHLAEGTTVMHEGFSQLQRRHPRGGDGRGPDKPRSGGRRRQRRRRRGLDPGHLVGWRQGAGLHRPGLPARSQRRTGNLAGR